MPAALALVLSAVGFALLSLRPDVPAGARTPRQLCDTARRTGPARCALRVVWAVVVVALLALAAASAYGARIVYEAATLLWLLAAGIASLSTRPAMTGGQA